MYVCEIESGGKAEKKSKRVIDRDQDNGAMLVVLREPGTPYSAIDTLKFLRKEGLETHCCKHVCVCVWREEEEDGL